MPRARRLQPIPSAPASAPPPPTAGQLQAAYDARVPDLLFPGMRVLLCGINPSLWSGYAGYHFARPANRLWPTLHLAGFTPRRLHPAETDALRAAGIGITNMVARATARADELHDEEIRTALPRLEATAVRWRPRYLAVLGLGAYRLAFGDRGASVGPQTRTLGPSRVWLLPNPSGLNAHYNQAALTDAFAELHRAATRLSSPA
jgi:TDG/mug DNA glycosylase family protein